MKGSSILNTTSWHLAFTVLTLKNNIWPALVVVGLAISSLAPMNANQGRVVPALLDNFAVVCDILAQCASGAPPVRGKGLSHLVKQAD